MSVNGFRKARRDNRISPKCSGLPKCAKRVSVLFVIPDEQLSDLMLLVEVLFEEVKERMKQFPWVEVKGTRWSLNHGLCRSEVGSYADQRVAPVFHIEISPARYWGLVGALVEFGKRIGALEQ